jgi:uncharacterized protein (DUF302 family)
MSIKEDLDKILGRYQTKIKYGNFDDCIKEIFKAFEDHGYREIAVLDGYWSD